MAKGPSLARDPTVHQARLHHLLCALSVVHHGEAGSLSEWRGDGREGEYVHHDGSGNTVSLAWNEAGVVALASERESVTRGERRLAPGARKPLRHLPGLPAALNEAAERAADGVARLATAGLWAAGGGGGTSLPLVPLGAHGVHRLLPYALAADAAVFGRGVRQGWLELTSLSEAQGRLALRLASALRRAPAPGVALAPEDDDVILAHPETGRAARDLGRARRAAEMLASAGVRWRVPEERIARAAAEHEAHEAERVAAAMAPRERALFEAARRDEVGEVCRLLAAGAEPNARTVEGQWPYTPAGDTPLVQAIKAKAYGAARALIDAGADLAPANAFGQTALIWAARQSELGLVASMLARGADPNAVESGGDTALHAAAFAGNEPIAAALLAAGAARGARRFDGRTPAECARASGHPGLAARLAV
jgi:ankyrin repeat protein